MIWGLACKIRVFSSFAIAFMDRLLTKNQKKLCGFPLKMKNHRVPDLRPNDLSSLGCLDRVEFLLLGLYGGFDVCGHVTGTVFPFQGRIRCGRAVHAGGIFRHSLAPRARFHHRQAVAFVIAAAGGCHEYAVFPFPNSCTDHDENFLKTCGLHVSKPQRPLSSTSTGGV
jgi:hypothetical protein